MNWHVDVGQVTFGPDNVIPTIEGFRNLHLLKELI